MNIACIMISLLMLGGMQPYSDRGFADFDDFFTALESNGIWRPYDEGAYVFITNPPSTPYRDGQWFYTDFGWAWKGNHPASWATEHYGNWIFDKKSSTYLWKPADKWYPSIVQWRITDNFIGWRACELDAYGNPSPHDENNREPSEWNFVPKEKLRGPLKPEDFISISQVEKILKKSIPATHTFKTWRSITRTGPDPLTIWNDKDHPLQKLTIYSVSSPNATPIDGNPKSVFFYRPKFQQDTEGIFRRIEILIKRSKQDPNITAPPADDPRKKVLEALSDMPAETEKPAEEKAPEKSILFQETAPKQK